MITVYGSVYTVPIDSTHSTIHRRVGSQKEYLLNHEQTLLFRTQSLAESKINLITTMITKVAMIYDY